MERDGMKLYGSGEDWERILLSLARLIAPATQRKACLGWSCADDGAAFAGAILKTRMTLYASPQTSPSAIRGF